MREIYLAEARADADSIDPEMVEEPKLANYPVQPHLLFAAFSERVDRIVAAARIREINTTENWCRYAEECWWRDEIFDPFRVHGG
ncbi:hypothetical protein [Terriglobus sp.]|uniref:hypothetical protein n=1 Tax=Terriglobus sp. TaxID=1889013 RepID=UPI003AFFD6E8